MADAVGGLLQVNVDYPAAALSHTLPGGHQCLLGTAFGARFIVVLREVRLEERP